MTDTEPLSDELETLVADIVADAATISAFTLPTFDATLISLTPVQLRALLIKWLTTEF